MMNIHELVRPTKGEWKKIRERRDYEFVRRGYNDLQIVHGEDAKPFYAEIAKHLLENGISTSAKVLDAGCGTGIMCRELGAKGFKDISAFDISDDHVKATEPYVKRAFRATCEEIPEPDSSYDVVTHICVIEHVMVVEKALSEMNRILKPGGYLYITTDNSWWQTLITLKQALLPTKKPYSRFKQPIDGDFTSWEMKRLLDKAGFDEVSFYGVGGIPLGNKFVEKIMGKPTRRLPLLRHFTTRFSYLVRKR